MGWSNVHTEYYGLRVLARSAAPKLAGAAHGSTSALRGLFLLLLLRPNRSTCGIPTTFFFLLFLPHDRSLAQRWTAASALRRLCRHAVTLRRQALFVATNSGPSHCPCLCPFQVFRRLFFSQRFGSTAHSRCHTVPSPVAWLSLLEELCKSLYLFLQYRLLGCFCIL